MAFILSTSDSGRVFQSSIFFSSWFTFKFQFSSSSRPGFPVTDSPRYMNLSSVILKGTEFSAVLFWFNCIGINSLLSQFIWKPERELKWLNPSMIDGMDSFGLDTYNNMSSAYSVRWCSCPLIKTGVFAYFCSWRFYNQVEKVGGAGISLPSSTK